MSLVELARFASAAEAHIVRARLESAGIPAHCFDSGMNLAEGVPLLFQVRLMVLDADLDEARTVIGEAPGPIPDQPAEAILPAGFEGYRTGQRKRRMARALMLAVGVFLFAVLLLGLGLPPHSP